MPRSSLLWIGPRLVFPHRRGRFVSGSLARMWTCGQHVWHDGRVILLRLVDLMARWDLSKTAALRWASKDGFPAPRQVLGNSRLWSERDVAKWEAGRRRAGLAVPGDWKRKLSSRQA